MRFIVSTSTLLKQLQAVNGASSSSTVLPILENFLFEIKDGVLTVSATDLQTSMTTSLAVESKEDGKVAIPSKILLETLKTLPDQPISFSVDDKTFAIEINAGDGKYKLSGENGEDFPKRYQRNITLVIKILILWVHQIFSYIKILILKTYTNMLCLRTST